MYLTDLFYGGEGVTVEQPQAYICPFCSKMGYNETSLQEHVTSDHAETSVEVVGISFHANSFIFRQSFNLPSSKRLSICPLRFRIASPKISVELGCASVNRNSWGDNPKSLGK